MSNVERVLWRIAELGARCSQHAAAGGHGPLWAELEQTINGLDVEFEAARQAVDIAPAQVRSLEGRLNVAKKERDRERARAEECFADAESARRERDRERQKARKATATATEAKALAAECMARTAAAEAACDQALAARDQAVSALDEAVATGERAMDARDRAVRDLDGTRVRLDETTARLADLEAVLETTRAERDALMAASTGRDDAVDTLAARAEGAVVVLPGVALPEAQAGPVKPAKRVSWRPTWSEWSRDDTDDDERPAVAVTHAAGPDLTDTTDTTDVTDVAVTEVADEISLDDADGGTRRYLNVAATIGQLLPEDLAPLLMAGATVVRREGRLFATVAVTTDTWAAPGFDGSEQAQKLADAGFRVEWTSVTPLAC